MKVEVYACTTCKAGDFSEVEELLKSKVTGATCSVNDITRYTKDGQVELKRCEVECATHEEAVELAEKLRVIERMETVMILNTRDEELDNPVVTSCSIL